MLPHTPNLNRLAEIIQLATAPVFLLAGLGAFLNVCVSQELVGIIATNCGPQPCTGVCVSAVAPAINAPVAHWLSDLRKARFDAQRRLAVSLASLAAAHVDARGQVGDSDPVQAVEDTLRTFPAQEVVFVTASDRQSQVEEVRRRLDRRVRVLSPV